MDNEKLESTNWEELCHQCGTCCFEKLEDDSGTVFFTSTPCRYLDITTRRCKVYERRFTINPDCIQLSPALVKNLNWLHDDCGYRRAMGIERRPGRCKKTKQKTTQGYQYHD